MILVIDNYDSFTYNLVQYLGELGADCVVKRNDALTIDAVKRMKPKKIVISPGPKGPAEAGLSVVLIKAFAGVIPILGVCLGHQCIGYAFGAKVGQAQRLMHGKTSMICHDGRTIFANLPNPFEATRYHSLIVEGQSLPACFEVSAWTNEGEVMGIRHKEFPLEGVQFHPESILTECGKELLANFLKL